MAKIEIGPLTDRLSDDEIVELTKHLAELDAPELPQGDSSSNGTVGEGIGRAALEELLDRLDMIDAAAEIYLPIEFDGVVEVGDMRIASLEALKDALEELRDELEIDDHEGDDEDEDEDDDEEDDRRDSEAAVREAWHVFADGVAIAIDKKMPMHVRS